VAGGDEGSFGYSLARLRALEGAMGRLVGEAADALEDYRQDVRERVRCGGCGNALPCSCGPICDECERDMVVQYHVVADGRLIDVARYCWQHRPGVDMWGQEQ
jgi:hypothetical protein